MIRKIHLKEYEEVNGHWVDEARTAIDEILRANGFYIEIMEELVGQLSVGTNNVGIYINSTDNNRYYLSFKFSTNKVDIFATYTDKFIISNYGITIQPKEINNMKKAIEEMRRYLLEYVKKVF
jgi:hypothetical protein